MDYSIVIPVFNKAALTRQCLQTIRPTLEGAGEGEIIVIDNASSDETPQMLSEFPWVRMVRNESNRGFSGANNQGAKLARGEFLVLLNNDIVAHAGWLASMLRIARDPGVGAVGARLLFPNGTIQHAGVRVDGTGFGTAAFVAFHDMYGYPGDYAEARAVRDLQVVTGACLVTPRRVYEELGGLDEGFWNGYEDVDYCLKLRERGLRVVYDGNAVLTHFESQSGGERFRKVSWNVARLAHRWNGRVDFDAQRTSVARGVLRRIARIGPGVETMENAPLPRVTIVCHGDVDESTRLEGMLLANRTPVERIVYARACDAVAAAREAMEIRGDRRLALVDARCELEPGWLDALVGEAECTRNCAASTYVSHVDPGQNVALYTADARCTLLRLAKLPQHVRLRDFPTLGGSVADVLVRAIGEGAGTRSVSSPLGTVPQLEADAEFERLHGIPLERAVAPNEALVEAALRAAPRRRAGLVSIVMLSWNALQFTKIALESIRTYTNGEYEVIIVDNGSGPETVEWLRSLEDVRVIFNRENRGFAGGNNQAMAAAKGEYVVLLNNDVIVTEGWLDGLLGAFDRIPALGVSAPRSNKIAGDQIVADCTYENETGLHEYARKRRERFRAEGYATDRAIGLCLCIDRRVIDEIGGIDERFGVGNFEDDDFCLRVRAAGYTIFVCDDVFIHHFGSQTFAANKVDWSATMRRNWRTFALKWGYPETYPEAGYPTTPAIARGYDRSKHYVALPNPTAQTVERTVELAFTARVRSERDWNDVGAFVRRYLQAFTAADPTLLSLAVSGELSAREIGGRVEKLLGKLGVDSLEAADVEISDDGACTVAAARVIALEELSARNPGALRRLLEQAAR